MLGIDFKLYKFSFLEVTWQLCLIYRHCIYRLQFPVESTNILVLSHAVYTRVQSFKNNNVSLLEVVGSSTISIYIGTVDLESSSQ